VTTTSLEQFSVKAMLIQGKTMCMGWLSVQVLLEPKSNFSPPIKAPLFDGKKPLKE